MLVRKILPEVFSVCGLCRDSSLLNQLVAFLGMVFAFGTGCFLFWFLVATFLTLSGAQLDFFFSVRGFFTAVLSCLVSSQQNFLVFSWFLLYSPTILLATVCISRGFCSGVTDCFIGFFSVIVARSFFLITVFFNGVPIVNIR